MPISPEKWEQIAELYESAMALAVEERGRFIEQACSDPEMASAVSRLIAEDELAGDFLNEPLIRVAEALEHPAPSRVGTMLQSRYQIVKEIGRGGSGEVYLARDTAAGDTEVVIKLLREAASANRWVRRKFSSEAEALGRLEHPGIVRILSHGETPEGEPFVVMEFVPGVTLRSELKPGPLPLRRTASIIRQVGLAIDYAHQRGVVHRDLKPENIMLESPAGDTVKVIDFGIAQVRGGKNETETGVRLIAGTLRYMAPEQLLGEPCQESDVYSLGVIAYEMIAGNPPFTDEGAVAILKQQGAGRVRDLRNVRRGISWRAWQLIRSALSFQAGDRPKVWEFADQLATALERGARLGPLPAFASAHRQAVTLLVSISTAAAMLATAIVISWQAPQFNKGLAMTQLTRDPGITTEPAISHNGALLAYVSDRAGEGKLDLWLQPIRSRNATRLTHRRTDVREPSFSPDGETIVFVSEPDGGVYLIPTRGGPEKRIDNGPAHRPRFSPDGKWIAYWSGTETSGDPFARSSSNVVVIPSAGGSWRQIAPSFIAASHPVWSPDSKAILFAGLRQPNADVARFGWGLLRLDQALPVDVGTAVDISTHFPDEWLTDGRVISTSAYPGTNLSTAYAGGYVPAELWTIKLSRSGQIEQPARNVALNGYGDAGPTASAQGTTVSGIVTQKSDIAIIDSKANVVLLESDSRNHQFLELSLDGRSLVYDSTRPGFPPLLNVRSLNGGVKASSITTGAINWIGAAQTGDSVFFQSAGRLFRVAASQNQVTPLCTTSTRPWDVSPDEHYLLSMIAGRTREIGVLNLHECKPLESIGHTDMNLYLARFSPDGEWVAFEAKTLPPGRARIYVARFQPDVKSDPGSWIAVSDGETFDGPVRWAPDGKSIVYLSKRDGFSCLWRQQLDRRKRPLGDPVAVWHLHSATRYMDREFSVARDKIAVILHERRGNLWLVK